MIRSILPLRPALLATVALGAAMLCPATASAQLLARVKAQAAERVKQTRSRADSTVMTTTGRLADSTFGKTDRAVSKAATAVSSAADTALNRTERGVGSAVHGLRGQSDGDVVDAGLATGHLALREPAFAPGSAELPAAALDRVRTIARALLAGTGTYLVEGHAFDGADAAANQALSERRAAAMKAALVAAGVPAGRLFATGYGATRPPSDGGAPSRIELTRMQ
jgi:outer membrane protein OmpA-like peptidoglycan-associated protein